MASSKQSLTIAQAEAMGMLAPKHGLIAMEYILHGFNVGNVLGNRGVAPIRYWQSLLQGLKEVPGVFNVVVSNEEVSFAHGISSRTT